MSGQLLDELSKIPLSFPPTFLGSFSPLLQMSIAPGDRHRVQFGVRAGKKADVALIVMVRMTYDFTKNAEQGRSSLWRRA